MKRLLFVFVGVFGMWVAVVGCDSSPEAKAGAQPAETTNGAAETRRVLRVAVFALVPDAAMAISDLKIAFQKAHKDIDLEVSLLDPYHDKGKDPDALVAQFNQYALFDVVEIDMCRYTDLVKAGQIDLDPLPASVGHSADFYVKPATLIAGGERAKYALPHWVCGNFLAIWSDNTQVANANGFSAFLAALEANHAYILADFCGGTGLGEFYADALVDQQGPDEARRQLKALGANTPDKKVDPEAKKAVVTLAKHLSPTFLKNRQHYHDVASYMYPRTFVSERKNVLLGYSESLYFVGREMEAEDIPVAIEQAKIIVKPFAFAEAPQAGAGSRGTPTWTDAFVIPKGRLKDKTKDIEAFLAFILGRGKQNT